MTSGKVLRDFIDFDITKNDNAPKFKDDDVGFIKAFVVKMLKTLYNGHMSLKISRMKKLQGLFMRSNSKRPIKQSLGSKTYCGERERTCMSNRRNIIIHSIAGLIKRIWYIKMSQYFPEPYLRSGRNVKVRTYIYIYIYHYPTKAKLKGAKGITDTFVLASKTDLAGLKTKVDNLNVDKIKIVQLIFVI